MNLLDNFGKYFIINSMGVKSRNIIDFSDLNKVDVELIGKKAETISKLIQIGIRIPDGFIIPPLSDMSDNSIKEVHNAYKKISGLFKQSSLNIFTSPLKGKSLQFLDIKGDANLIVKIKEIWASHINNPVAIIVQKNINSKIKGTIITHSPTKELEQIAKKIQKYFYFPQKVDYVLEKGKIYVTQVTPFTGVIKESYLKVSQKRMQKVLIKATPINSGIVTGIARVINLNHKNFKVKRDEILIVPKLDIKLYENIKRARGIVVDTVLPNSQALIIYKKDIKIPTIIGAKNATKILQNRNVITINGVSGEIYQGGFV